jgi:hypothetical protein
MLLKASAYYSSTKSNYKRQHKKHVQGDSSFTARMINPIKKLVKIMKL